jgi:hypothetical protein
MYVCAFGGKSIFYKKKEIFVFPTKPKKENLILFQFFLFELNSKNQNSFLFVLKKKKRKSIK